MRLVSKKLELFIVVCILMLASTVNAQDTVKEKEIKVSLRMIGHQVLLNSGDSTSRVLPIVKEENRYRIQFESGFEFIPEKLVSIVDQIVKQTNLDNNYIVEVEHCDSKELVYSFKMDEQEHSDIIPCKNRGQPEGCYTLLFTFLETNETSTGLNAEISNYLIIGVLLLTLGFIYFIWWKRRKVTLLDPNLIPLGSYQFDKRNTELLIEHQRIELTSKEADLLLLLHDAANETVKREDILNRVWGDEGGYVGRTLDVFISKLRKKLEFDSKVRIVNIRGVGYKLVMDV